MGVAPIYPILPLYTGVQSERLRRSPAAPSTSPPAPSRPARRVPPLLLYLSASCRSGVRYSATLSASTATSMVAMPSGAPAAPLMTCDEESSLSVM